MSRYEPATPFISPEAGCDVTLQGKTIQAGELIGPLGAAANGDPRLFARPDRFDITRVRTPRRGHPYMSWSASGPSAYRSCPHCHHTNLFRVRARIRDRHLAPKFSVSGPGELLCDSSHLRTTLPLCSRQSASAATLCWQTCPDQCRFEQRRLAVASSPRPGEREKQKRISGKRGNSLHFLTGEVGTTRRLAAN